MQDGTLGNSSTADNIIIRLLLWVDSSCRFGLVSLGESLLWGLVTLGSLWAEMLLGHLIVFCLLTVFLSIFANSFFSFLLLPSMRFCLWNNTSA